MELSELLMMEHISLRLQFRRLAKERTSADYLALHDFVLNCHAKVEDETLFPRILEAQELPPQVAKTIRSLEADHKLITKFGESMNQWMNEGSRDLFDKRIDNYIKTVESHNSAEEKEIFPSWRQVQESEREAAMKEAKSIIEAFGFDKYTRITGISQEFYNMLW